jgi:(4S)-4-hydroxy-5-phosphonooxypentane-2,3-dione isomerase
MDRPTPARSVRERCGLGAAAMISDCTGIRVRLDILDSVLILQVFIHVKPESLDAFLEATKENSRNSVQEPGCVRFDILQQKDDSTRIILHEVYKDESDLDHHRTTSHFARWRDTVPQMFVEPRYSVQFHNVYPADSEFR